MSVVAHLGLWIGALEATAAGGLADHPDPAVLVRQVRQRESWIDRIESLSLKAEIRWERTPRGVEYRRRELRKQFPNADLGKFRELYFHTEQVVEQAFDRERIRLRIEDIGHAEDLRIWDGKRFILRNRYVQLPEQDGTLISREPENWIYWLLWSNFDSFRTGPHDFWWTGPKQLAEVTALMGKPEDFAYEGTTQFRGTKCHVVSRWESWTSLFISVEDGRLCGIRSGAQATRKLTRTLVTLFRAKGHDVKDETDVARVSASIPRDELEAIYRAGASQLSRLIDPCFEYWQGDEKELAPGCWLPMTQGVSFTAVNDDGNPFESQRHYLKIVEARVNEQLPDALFATEVKEGERINDQTTEPPVTYPYKNNRTPQEWAEVLEAGKELAARNRVRPKRQAAPIGFDAFDFPSDATWLNSKALTRNDLAGKVVILDFWAEWSGPCRSDLPGLAALHKKLANEVFVIGVHPPGSDLDAIKKVMKEFALEYPICVDVAAPKAATTWGALHEAYGVNRIPHVIVIDQQGKIAARGGLGDVVAKAAELAGRGH